jgi:methionine--tRNA ligase beta chain
MADTITFEEFKKIEIRIGKVTLCEKVEGADKLLRLEVDFGEFGKRQIASAIAEFYKPEDLEGKLLPFIVNLEPRTFRGVQSQGMLMATGTHEDVVLLEPNKEVPEGSEVV